jgi:protein-tyrosine phosphatase
MTSLSPVSPIIDGVLFQGGVDAPYVLQHPAKLHVACAHECPPLPDGAEAVLFFPLHDDPTEPWLDHALWCRQVGKVALAVARSVSERRHTLVTCAMGLNRSGLVTALALRYLGMTPSQAIRTVRDNRSPDALFNRQFVRVVKYLPL